jgi:hypothetical protein
MLPALIATDVDGTLLDDDERVSARTRNVIQAAVAAGAQFVLATGRPPRWIPPVVDALGDRGLVVCANGALVYDPARHELVARVELDPEVALGLVDDLEAAFPTGLIGVEQGFDAFAVDEAIVTREPELYQRWNRGEMRMGPIRSFLDQPVTKMLVRLREGPPGTAARVQEIVGDRALVTHATDEALLELSHPSVHKAATVERLLGESGIEPGEVAAFGDMPNDIELIRWAGLGVAVGNAHPAVKEAADEVTAANDDDGVAIVVERLLAPGQP